MGIFQVRLLTQKDLYQEGITFCVVDAMGMVLNAANHLIDNAQIIIRHQV